MKAYKKTMLALLFCSVASPSFSVGPGVIGSDEELGRWVNFGVRGGQPQGGLVCAPNNTLYTSGDITGIRKSVTGGGDWFLISDPTSPAAFASYTVMALDFNTFLDGIEGNEVLYVAKETSRFPNPNYSDYDGNDDSFSLARSTDSGVTWNNVGEIKAFKGNKGYRYSPLSVAPTSAIGYGVFAMRDDTSAEVQYLYSFTRSGDAVDISGLLALCQSNSGTATWVYDVKAFADYSALITTDVGVFLINEQGSSATEVNLPSGAGEGRYMYVNPLEPSVVWMVGKLNSGAGTLLRSDNGGANWQIINGSLDFAPGIFAVYGSSGSGSNYVVAIASEEKDNPYQQGAFRDKKMHYSSDGGSNFYDSTVAQRDGSDPEYPIETTWGGVDITQICATPTLDSSMGVFHMSVFGGYQFSDDNGENFSWSNRGIYGLTAFAMDASNGRLTVTHNDHGMFRSDVGAAGEDSWTNLLYNNWVQIDRQLPVQDPEGLNPTPKRLTSATDLVVDPRFGGDTMYYIKTRPSNKENWLIRKTTNGAANYLTDWESVFSSEDLPEDYKIVIALDLYELWKNDKEVLLVGTRPIGGSTAAGIIRLENTGTGWQSTDMSAGLSPEAKAGIKSIDSSPYGELFIRTFKGVYRFDRSLNGGTWVAATNIPETGNPGDSHRNGIAFDDDYPEMVYIVKNDHIWRSTDFGNTFSDWRQLPLMDEIVHSEKGYLASSLRVKDGSIYAAMPISWPYIDDTYVTRGGVMKSDAGDASADWHWLSQKTLPRADVTQTMEFGSGGELYVGDGGSGLSRYEIIIDNEDADSSKPYYGFTFNNGAQWATADVVDPGKQFGPEVRNPRTSLVSDPGFFSRFIWQFQVPKAGYYKVYGWWNQVKNAVMHNDVEYKLVKWVAGTETLVKQVDDINQQNYQSRWNELALVELEEGEIYKLKMHVSADAGGKVINADAVRIEPFKPVIVVDNEDPGFSFERGALVNHFEASNPWRYPYGPQKGNPATSRNKKIWQYSGEDNYSRWSFTVPESGNYEVSAWWAELDGSWQSKAVVYHVHYSDGAGGALDALCDPVDQTSDSNDALPENVYQWNRLTCAANSAFYFEKDTTYFVEIRENEQPTTGPGSQLHKHYNSDAIKVEFVGK